MSVSLRLYSRSTFTLIRPVLSKIMLYISAEAVKQLIDSTMHLYIFMLVHWHTKWGLGACPSKELVKVLTCFDYRVYGSARSLD